MQRELAPEKRRPTSAARYGRRGMRSLTRCRAIRRRQLRRQAGAGLGPGGGEARKIRPAASSNESQTGGLTEPFRSQTNARAEALHLAFRNAFVVLDGSGEAAHRTFRLPLWRGAIRRLEPARHRAKRRLHRQRHPEAVLRADDLPVRPGAPQYAEDEVMAAPVDWFVKSPSPCPSPRWGEGTL